MLPVFHGKELYRLQIFSRGIPILPVIVTNDANAAAVGEMIYGGAKGMKNFVVITLGTGLGQRLCH